MKRIFHVLCVAWLAVVIVGCGGATSEIQPKRDTGSTLTDAQKKSRDDEMKKAMERNGYGNKNMPVPKQPE